MLTFYPGLVLIGCHAQTTGLMGANESNEFVLFNFFFPITRTQVTKDKYIDKSQFCSQFRIRKRI